MMNLPNKPDKKEYRWLIYFSVLVIFITSLPYLIAFFSAGEDWVFTGFLFGVDDGNSYLAKMMRGWMGDWLFVTPYTYIPQTGTLALLPYFLLGKITTPLNQHTQLIVLFHLFRFVGVFMAIFASYEFFALFLKKISLRRWGVTLSVFGGGLGWLLVILGFGNVFGSQPLDFYSPESFGFFSYYGVPHLLMARSLLFWGMVRFFRQSLSKTWFDRVGLEIGLLWGTLAFFMQPLTAIIGGVVIVVYLIALLILRKAKKTEWLALFRRTIWAGILPLAVVLIIVYDFATDPFLKLWGAQNVLASPHPIHYLFAYGALLPLAYYGIRYLWQENEKLAIFLLGWLVIFPVLVYAPLTFQRRAAEGVFLVWLVLALAAFENKKMPAWLRPVFLTPLYLTSLFFLLGGSVAALTPSMPLFRSADEIDALTLFRSEIEQNAVVIASTETGNFLPVIVPARVVVGHGPESIGYYELNLQVIALFDAITSDETRTALFEEVNARYLYWGPLEQKLGDWEPLSESYLDLLVQAGDYYLFEIIEE